MYLPIYLMWKLMCEARIALYIESFWRYGFCFFYSVENEWGKESRPSAGIFLELGIREISATGVEFLFCENYSKRILEIETFWLNWFSW